MTSSAKLNIAESRKEEGEAAQVRRKVYARLLSIS